MTYRCTGGFAVYVDGQPQMYPGGALVDDDDPILKRNPAAFERVETYTARRSAVPQSVTATETATAAPGEARTVTKAAAPHQAKGTTKP